MIRFPPLPCEVDPAGGCKCSPSSNIGRTCSSARYDGASPPWEDNSRSGLSFPGGPSGLTGSSGSQRTNDANIGGRRHCWTISGRLGRWPFPDISACAVITWRSGGKSMRKSVIVAIVVTLCAAASAFAQAAAPSATPQQAPSPADIQQQRQQLQQQIQQLQQPLQKLGAGTPSPELQQQMQQVTQQLMQLGGGRGGRGAGPGGPPRAAPPAPYKCEPVNP